MMIKKIKKRNRDLLLAHHLPLVQVIVEVVVATVEVVLIENK